MLIEEAISPLAFVREWISKLLIRIVSFFIDEH